MTKEQLMSLLYENGWDSAEHTEQGMAGVAFKKKFNDNWIKYHLSDEGIKRITEKQLLKQLGSHDVSHMTRIVGYYSKVNNWNPSKLGELKDRQAGDYTFKEKG